MGKTHGVFQRNTTTCVDFVNVKKSHQVNIVLEDECKSTKCNGQPNVSNICFQPCSCVYTQDHGWEFVHKIMAEKGLLVVISIYA